MIPECKPILYFSVGVPVFFLGAHQAAEEWCRFWPVICSPHPGEILKHPLPEVIFVNSLEEHNKGKRNQETQIKGNQKVNDSF